MAVMPRNSMVLVFITYVHFALLLACRVCVFVCGVGDSRFQVPALPCSTPLRFEGSTPLIAFFVCAYFYRASQERQEGW
jgi:hypothetical protein